MPWFDVSINPPPPRWPLGYVHCTGCPKKCTTFVLLIVSIVSNTASSDLHQKIASFMEIYWHYLRTLSRVHGSHYSTCSKCLYFLATPHCAASGLLGQTLGWVNRANDRKDRLFQSSQGFWCPLVHNTLQIPYKKNPERWNPANMVASPRRRKGKKDAPSNGPAAKPGYRGMFVCESLVHLLETIVGWVCQRTFNLEPARSV